MDSLSETIRTTLRLKCEVKEWVGSKSGELGISENALIGLILREKMAAEGKIGVQTSAAGNKPEKDC